MSQFEQIFDSLKFKMEFAGIRTVADWWASVVDTFRFNRLYFITQGNAELTLITEKIQLRAGRMYFIPANSVLSGRCDDYMNHFFLHMIADTFTENLFKYTAFEREVDAPPYAADLFQVIIDNYRSDASYSRIVVDKAVKLLLANFFRNTGSINPNIVRFNEVLEYIEHNLDKKLTVTELARIMSLNEIYFSNLFTKTFGISPQNYIISKKINKACQMLTDRSMTVKEIVNELNFYDEAYFSRLFKKKTNMSPKTFRETIHE